MSLSIIVISGFQFTIPGHYSRPTNSSLSWLVCKNTGDCNNFPGYEPRRTKVRRTPATNLSSKILNLKISFTRFSAPVTDQLEWHGARVNNTQSMQPGSNWHTRKQTL